MVSYFADCTRDSSEGGTRAPESIGNQPDLSDAIWQCLYVITTILLFALPTIGLYFWRGLGPIFWTAVGISLFLLPIALLSTIIMDTVSILHPWLWISGIAKTLFPYLGLLLLIYLPLLPLPFMSPLLVPFQRYFFMVGAHLLGRFYFNYEKRLGWLD